MAKKALVTGGAGFIGSTLVDRLLAEDWSVDVVDDLSTGSLANLAEARAVEGHRFSFHRFDVRTPGMREVLLRAKPDVVFHLAAQIDVRVSVANPILDAEINIIGSLNVLEGCVDAGVSKVVFASSGGTIYGLPDEIPTRSRRRRHPSRRTASPRRSSATTCTSTAKRVGSNPPRSRLRTCTARVRTRTVKPVSSRSSRASCSPARLL